jgi:outer membrane protein OmpA-like peptidoglycan-associated protein
LLSFNWGSSTPPADTDGDGVIDRRDDCPGTPRGAIVDARGCPADSDGDGVWDGIDQCPDTPKGWPVDQNGCPADSDGDGVPDGEDACPATPAGATVNDTGCPIDTDGDGVYDGIDQCPDTPAGATVDDTGCPADSDGDGVYDGVDQCPDTPEGATVDDTGCPTDSDGDGVYDGIDRCPDTPKGTPVDVNGCPSFGEKTARGAFVLRGVNFELNSATLTGGSGAILDLVAQTLAAYPEAIVEVSGHTDTTGSASYNLALSEKRANAVRDYLISKGIDGDRLRAKGYGETSPIAEGNTEDAHAQNRRVEVRRVN